MVCRVRRRSDCMTWSELAVVGEDDVDDDDTIASSEGRALCVVHCSTEPAAVRCVLLVAVVVTLSGVASTSSPSARLLLCSGARRGIRCRCCGEDSGGDIMERRRRRCTAARSDTVDGDGVSTNALAESVERARIGAGDGHARGGGALVFFFCGGCWGAAVGMVVLVRTTTTSSSCSPSCTARAFTADEEDESFLCCCCSCCCWL